MAATICYSRSIGHFRFLFQKTIANPVLGHGMIKLLKPPHTAGIWVRALHDPIQELSMTLPRHKPRYPTMATSICFSRSIVHFRYPFQKTIASPVLGHGMTKLLKPPHTAGIWVRALHDSSSRELSFNGTGEKYKRCRTVRDLGQSERYTCEDDIRDLLSSPIDSEHDLSEILKHMESHPEEDGGLVYLYREILMPGDISTMWKIAGDNRRNHDMLPLKNHSCVKWGGKSEIINKEISGRKRKRDDEDLQKPLEEFPLGGEWEMELHRCGDEEAYNVVFKGKKRRLHGWRSGEKKGLAFVKKNLNSIRADGEPFDFAIAFGADGPWRSSNPFVIYMRAAGPNVLIGQAWTGGENSKRLWAEVILVKRK